MLSCRHVQSGATAVLVTTALLCHTLATAASLRTRAATATLADMPMPKMAADFTVHVSENYTETTRFHWHHVTSYDLHESHTQSCKAWTGIESTDFHTKSTSQLWRYDPKDGGPTHEWYAVKPASRCYPSTTECCSKQNLIGYYFTSSLPVTPATQAHYVYQGSDTMDGVPVHRFLWDMANEGSDQIWVSDDGVPYRYTRIVSQSDGDFIYDQTLTNYKAGDPAASNFAPPEPALTCSSW